MKAISIETVFVGDFFVKSTFVKSVYYIGNNCVRVASSFDTIKYARIYLRLF